jgi:serine/threonine protein kinase
MCFSLTAFITHAQSPIGGQAMTILQAGAAQYLVAQSNEALAKKGGLSRVYFGTHMVTAQPVVFKVCKRAAAQKEWEMYRHLLTLAPDTVMPLTESELLTPSNQLSGVPLMSDDEACLVLLRGDGADLQGQLKHIDTALAIRALERVLNIVKVFHLNDLVWFDCKPSQFVFSNQAWKAVDLTGLTPVGTPLDDVAVECTRQYGAPEVLLGQLRHAETSVDVYSVGIIIAEVLMGLRYISCPSAQDITDTRARAQAAAAATATAATSGDKALEEEKKNDAQGYFGARANLISNALTEAFKRTDSVFFGLAKDAQQSKTIVDLVRRMLSVNRADRPSMASVCDTFDRLVNSTGLSSIKRVIREVKQDTRMIKERQAELVLNDDSD